MNTEEVLRFVEDELENEDVLQTDIALVPPEDGNDTGEDNADKDLGGDFIGKLQINSFLCNLTASSPLGHI